jgi:hypothetical protein
MIEFIGSEGIWLERFNGGAVTLERFLRDGDFRFPRGATVISFAKALPVATHDLLLLKPRPTLRRPLNDAPRPAVTAVREPTFA